jgi:hypothetical protein
MPIPNVSKDGYMHLFLSCKCGSDEFLQLYYDTDCPKDGISFHLVSFPYSLWFAVKYIWKHGKFLWHDLELTREDTIAMRDALNEYLKKTE